MALSKSTLSPETVFAIQGNIGRIGYVSYTMVTQDLANKDITNDAGAAAFYDIVVKTFNDLMLYEFDRYYPYPAELTALITDTFTPRVGDFADLLVSTWADIKESIEAGHGGAVVPDAFFANMEDEDGPYLRYQGAFEEFRLALRKDTQELLASLHH